LLGRLLGIGALVLLASEARAEVDTSKPLLCAVTEAVECGYESTCSYGPVEDLNIPAFIVVDAGAKQLREYHGDRTTSVSEVVERDGQLVLQGFENRAFSISISRESGRLSAAASQPDAAVVIFGVCTNQR
jgi:hypothetical protein